MKMTIHQLILFAICGGIAFAHSSKGQSILEKSVSLSAENARFKGVLSQLEQQTQVRFIYSSSAIDVRQRVNLQVTNQKLNIVLKELLHPLSIDYIVSGNRITLKKLVAGQGERGAAPILFTSETPDAVADRTVKGKVTDETGEPLPGVSIVIKETRHGMTTDANGLFSIVVPDENAVLVFSFVGYLNQEVMVGARSAIDIEMEVDEKSLEEVVVVGYGTQKRRDVTGAIASVPTERLEMVPSTNIA